MRHGKWGLPSPVVVRLVGLLAPVSLGVVGAILAAAYTPTRVLAAGCCVCPCSGGTVCTDEPTGEAQCKDTSSSGVCATTFAGCNQSGPGIFNGGSNTCENGCGGSFPTATSTATSTRTATSTAT